jgi:serine protease inhibitor
MFIKPKIKPKIKTSLIAALILSLFLFTILYIPSGSSAKAKATVQAQAQSIPKVPNVYITYPKLSFDKVVKTADLIAKVEIQSKISETSKKPYKTLFQAKLIEVYKGSLPKEKFIKLNQDGSSRIIVNDMPLFKSKEKLILFLQKDKGSANTFSVISGAANTFILRTNKSKSYVLKYGSYDIMLSSAQAINSTQFFNTEVQKFLSAVMQESFSLGKELNVFMENDFTKLIRQYVAESSSPFLVDYKVTAIDSGLLASSTQLGLDVFKSESMKQKSKNVIISPLSLFTALTVAMNGAKGQTLQQMKKIMGLESDSMDTLNGNMNALMNYANANKASGEPGVTNICNSLWINNTLQINDSYLKTVKKYYNSDTFNANFSSAQTVKDMNQWINDRTAGLLKNVVKSLDKNTALSIMNTLYFNGTWSSPFAESQTKKENFQLSSGSKIKVDMMNKEDTIGYYEDKQVKVGVFDYHNGSMMILMPKSDFSGYASSLKATDIENYNKNLERLSVKIKLPKFKVTTESKLEQTMINLGMTLPFDSDNADFSGILTDKSKLWISQLQQNCAVKVDEKGTEAAAVTIASIKLTCAIAASNKEFYVNKPFLFVIQGKGNMMLFIGKVENPTN